MSAARRISVIAMCAVVGASSAPAQTGLVGRIFGSAAPAAPAPSAPPAPSPVPAKPAGAKPAASEETPTPGRGNAKRRTGRNQSATAAAAADKPAAPRNSGRPASKPRAVSNDVASGTGDPAPGSGSPDFNDPLAGTGIAPAAPGLDPLATVPAPADALNAAMAKGRKGKKGSVASPDPTAGAAEALAAQPMRMGTDTTKMADQATTVVNAFLVSAQNGAYSRAATLLTDDSQRYFASELAPVHGTLKGTLDRITREGDILAVTYVTAQVRGEGAKVDTRVSYRSGVTEQFDFELLSVKGVWRIALGSRMLGQMDTKSGAAAPAADPSPAGARASAPDPVPAVVAAVSATQPDSPGTGGGAEALPISVKPALGTGPGASRPTSSTAVSDAPWRFR